MAIEPFEGILRRQKLRPELLASYGFAEAGDGWGYDTDILRGDFRLHVAIGPDGAADTRLVEAETGEEYSLYRTGAQGSIVGGVRGREEAERVVAETPIQLVGFARPFTKNPSFPNEWKAE